MKKYYCGYENCGRLIDANQIGGRLDISDLTGVWKGDKESLFLCDNHRDMIRKEFGL